jgi:hypothetical protein
VGQRHDDDEENKITRKGAMSHVGEGVAVGGVGNEASGQTGSGRCCKSDWVNIILYCFLIDLCLSGYALLVLQLVSLYVAMLFWCL